MKFFADTSDLKEIKYLTELKIIDGVTTNPSLVAKSGYSLRNLIKEICEIKPGHVSAEVISLEYDGMKREALELASIHEDVVIKLPATTDSLRLCDFLSNRGIRVNMTLCFSPIQALLAARYGAYYISPFIGRVEDSGYSGIGLIKEIKQIYEAYAYQTKILATSIRSISHIKEVMLIGVDVVTITPQLIKSMIMHPLTDKGLDMFMQEWSNAEANF